MKMPIFKAVTLNNILKQNEIINRSPEHNDRAKIYNVQFPGQRSYNMEDSLTSPNLLITLVLNVFTKQKFKSICKHLKTRMKRICNCCTVLRIIKLNKFPVSVLLRSVSGILKLCRCFTMFCDI